ncbi:hypothetical protein Clacol_008755 [Clathrus columnatus]|uniref:Uncharacterized protein n=1 Tax=Clathrus columnatus TaxID=1419009 RepID=A0AAV5AIL7_9AGAM|nr:hypothetical protein Clacol_008755 [Clathrus columnatus]
MTSGSREQTEVAYKLAPYCEVGDPTPTKQRGKDLEKAQEVMFYRKWYSSESLVNIGSHDQTFED